MCWQIVLLPVCTLLCRLAAARQAHRRSSPVRGSLASAQQLQQPQEGVSGWSYPRGRELRLRASREGRLGHTTRSSIVSVSSTLPFSVPVVYPRARSTSPTLGMHYLERSGSGRRRTGGSLSPVRSSYTTSSAVSSTSSAPFKVNGVGGGAAGAGGPSPKGATGQAVVADYESFVLACKVRPLQPRVEDLLMCRSLLPRCAYVWAGLCAAAGSVGCIVLCA